MTDLYDIALTQPKQEWVYEQYPVGPFRCPVCLGKGIVPSGFYLMPGPYHTTTSTAPEMCRSCSGTGVLWQARKQR